MFIQIAYDVEKDENTSLSKFILAQLIDLLHTQQKLKKKKLKKIVQTCRKNNRKENTVNVEVVE